MPRQRARLLCAWQASLAFCKETNPLLTIHVPVSPSHSILRRGSLLLGGQKLRSRCYPGLEPAGLVRRSGGTVGAGLTPMDSAKESRVERPRLRYPADTFKLSDDTFLRDYSGLSTRVPEYMSTLEMLLAK